MLLPRGEADQGGTVEPCFAPDASQGRFFILILYFKSKEVIIMKFSKKIESCELSPVRKFYPYEAAAVKRGIRVLHMNIGQPDIETPKVFFDAIRNFGDKVLEYAPAPGIPTFV